MSGKKRQADKHISRDDHDACDESGGVHQPGSFQEAPPEVLAQRKIVKARRKPSSAGSAEAKKTLFAQMPAVQATPPQPPEDKKPAEGEPKQVEVKPLPTEATEKQVAPPTSPVKEAESKVGEAGTSASPSKPNEKEKREDSAGAKPSEEPGADSKPFMLPAPLTPAPSTVPASTAWKSSPQGALTFQSLTSPAPAEGSGHEPASAAAPSSAAVASPAPSETTPAPANPFAALAGSNPFGSAAPAAAPTTSPFGGSTIFNPAAAKPFPYPFKVSAAAASNPFGSFNSLGGPSGTGPAAPPSKFTFELGTPLGNSAASSNAVAVAGEEENPEEFQPKEDAAAAQKIPLVPEQKVDSGEEGETTIWKGPAKLLELVTNKSSFKERGSGELRVNEKEIDGKKVVRLLMRMTGTLRVILNVSINPTSVRFSLSHFFLNAHGRSVKLSMANAKSLRVVALEPGEDPSKPHVATHVVRLPSTENMDLLVHLLKEHSAVVTGVPATSKPSEGKREDDTKKEEK